MVTVKGNKGLELWLQQQLQQLHVLTGVLCVCVVDYVFNIAAIADGGGNGGGGQ